MDGNFRNRILLILLLIISLLLYGVLGYEIIEGWNLLDAFYMVVITLTTVGFREVHTLSHMGMLFTISLILFGTGILFYGMTSVASYILEGDIPELLRRRRMDRKIRRMKGHFIVCGAGNTGKHVVAELKKAGREFVVVDRNEDVVKSLGDVVYVIGDATQDSTLIEAGIKDAGGLVASLSSDADNLFLVLTARGLNPDLRIVARCLEESSIPKLQKAGADYVVSPHIIGGLRIASRLIRPGVVSFLDTMLREEGGTLRIEEAVVSESSGFCGMGYGELKDRIEERFNVLLLAVFRGETHIFNPDRDLEILPNDTVIMMGEVEECRKVRDVMG